MFRNEIWTKTRNLFAQVSHFILEISRSQKILRYKFAFLSMIAIYTTYYRASRFGKSTAVSILLERGASVNVRNNFGSTPLHLACEYGHLEIVQVRILVLIIFSKEHVGFPIVTIFLHSHHCDRCL